MSLPAILQQLGQNTLMQNPNLAQIQNLAQTIKNVKNPQAFLQQMLAQRNPQLQQAIDYVQKNGGDPKAAFQKLAAEKGIDPTEIERMFK